MALNVIALISGGKDSLYSILHCIQHGHEIVALANLHPPTHGAKSIDKPEIDQASPRGGEVADLDSFMFQTVGYSVIPLYAKALGIPLYRRAITGTAVVTDRDYAFTAGENTNDETEDLIPLLQEILSHHPAANAISTGAIQSTYQRTRIESVALRFGLVPLSYLWQYPVLPPPVNREDSLTGLLDDMASAGCDARIIKLASGGISERLLWANVTSHRTRQALVRGLAPFFDNDELGLRGAVVGEGGEFETITLDGPPEVWKNGRIVVDIDETKIQTGDGGTSYVNLGPAYLADHHFEVEVLNRNRERDPLVPIPVLLDHDFDMIQKTLSGVTNSQAMHEDNSQIASSASLRDDGSSLSSKPTYTMTVNGIQLSNLTHVMASDKLDAAGPLSVASQMEAIASIVRILLAGISTRHCINPKITTTSIVHTLIVLRSMDFFSVINPIYASMFSSGIPNPPARVTIAAPLPDGVDVSLSLVIDLSPRRLRRGLHVQSRSYWVPANIGPYSQAITVPFLEAHNEFNAETDFPQKNMEVVHVAGQIPLVPATMELLEGPFHQQAVLALQHLWRLGQERQVDAWGIGVAFLALNHPSYAQNPSFTYTGSRHWAIIAASAWTQKHHVRIGIDESEETAADEIDVWHARYNRSAPTQQYQQTKNIHHHLHSLPYDNEDGTIVPPFLAAEVTALPRNAPIEWWSIGFSKLMSSIYENTHAPIIFWTRSANNHICSSLTIMTASDEPSEVLKLVVYLVKHVRNHTNVQSGEGMYTTITDILTKGLDESSSDGFQLVSGNAYIAADAKHVWRDLRAEAPILSEPTSNEKFDVPILTDITTHIRDTAAVTYVHSLSGHGGYQRNSPTNNNDIPSVQLSDLDAAFLFQLRKSEH